MTRGDEVEAVARALCLIDGVDPDSTIDKVGQAPEPRWHGYRELARRELATAGAGENDVRRWARYRRVTDNRFPPNRSPNVSASSRLVKQNTT
jgi:hypothetical protein